MEKGIMPHEKTLIAEHILYQRAVVSVPERFHDFRLINKGRPYSHNQMLKDGYYLSDLQRVVNRFDGISWEYLAN